MGRSHTSAIDLPPTRTASTSGLRRAPLQTGHGTSRMNASYFSLDQSDSVSACRRSRKVTTPSKPVEYCRSRPHRFR